MTADLIKHRPEHGHDHGQMYRCKMVPINPSNGPVQFGEWFGTESDVREAFRGTVRELGMRYYCETKTMTCPLCDANENAKVICSL